MEGKEARCITRQHSDDHTIQVIRSNKLTVCLQEKMTAHLKKYANCGSWNTIQIFFFWHRKSVRLF